MSNQFSINVDLGLQLSLIFVLNSSFDEHLLAAEEGWAAPADKAA